MDEQQEGEKRRGYESVAKCIIRRRQCLNQLTRRWRKILALLRFGRTRTIRNSAVTGKREEREQRRDVCMREQGSVWW